MDTYFNEIVTVTIIAELKRGSILSQQLQSNPIISEWKISLFQSDIIRIPVWWIIT